MKAIPYFLLTLICLLNSASANIANFDQVERLRWINLEAIKLAMQDMSQMEGYPIEEAKLQYTQLQDLVKQGFEGIPGEQRAQRALELKRAILLSNPLIAGKSIIATRYDLGKKARQAYGMELGTPYSNWSSQGDVPRKGFNASIVEINDIGNKQNTREVYRADVGGPISDMRLHWDAQRVIFAQPRAKDALINVHELNLKDGKVKELIECEEPDLDFFDATYLPDGRIIANSNIGYNGVPCINGSDSVSNMVSYNPADKSLRRLTFDQDANWNPTIMNNGRVMYTRWEYTDLTHYYSRIVMHMNPDGSANKALYGSGGMFPNSTFDISSLPGQASAFIGIITGHHGITRAGRLIIFDPQKNRKGAAGMLQELPYRNRKIKDVTIDYLVKGIWPLFIRPSVINENYFLVAAKLKPQSLWGIYLIDRFDNLTLIAQLEGSGFISPHLLVQRPTPPIIPDRVNLASKEATFFIQDIYTGEGLKGIPRGSVKELRLFSYEYAYLETPSNHDWQGIQSGWDIKRSLGTIPVEPDGSVIFKAPANTPISIQPIDKDGVALQWMRSWVVGQPGEMVSCVGCHESQNQIVIPKRVAASRMRPQALTPPEGGVRPFTFDLEIQPILDRSCISCHQGESKIPDLRAGTKDKLGFGTSYINLHPYVRRQGGEGDMAVLAPYEYHPNTSELVRMLKKGHHDVTLSDKEWRTLYNWIDYNAPYRGSFNHNVIDKKMPFCRNGGEQYHRRIELANKYGNGAGVDWKEETAQYAAKVAAAKSKVLATCPQQLAIAQSKSSEPSLANWPLSTEQAQALQAKEGVIRKSINIAKGLNIDFVRIPAGSFIMGSRSGEIDVQATSIVQIKKGFWMSELELNNAQLRAVFPDHNSKFFDQMWKDHVVQGYAANHHHQPAIRVSWQRAMEYCHKLSKKTGLNITLPTEAQWEWACRAGSNQDFWYGDLNTDFGDKENFADKTSLKFAVYGVNPRPMPSSHPKYKHYTFLPKDARFNDGALVTTRGKKYKPNAFGLHNMHGNVAEWTRSNYLPYPYQSEGESPHKVVRGGSYYERPKYSRAHSRKYYLPYQSVYNVGLRIIIED